MTKSTLGLLLLIITSLLSCQTTTKHIEEPKEEEQVITPIAPPLDVELLKEKANQARTFCQKKQLNTDFCILIQIDRHSGLERFFVYDLKNDSIMHRFLVAHGCCAYAWSETFSKEKPTLSNQEGSHCTSLGKYKIGARRKSEWGVKIKYLLHGLEKSNDQALLRQIVLHSWERIADQEVFPEGTVEGWGCPAISNQAFLTIDPLLHHSKTPVLLWIFCAQSDCETSEL